MTCIGGTSTIKSLVFQDKALAIVQGANTLIESDLKNFFITLDKYLFEEITIDASSDVTITSGNVGSSLGEVKFIGIIVTYPEKDSSGVLITEDAKLLSYEFPLGTELNLGKILFLSGTNKPGGGFDVNGDGLKITNPNAWAVSIKVLMVN